MDAGRLLGDEEPFGDGAVRRSGGEDVEHLTLTGRQGCEPPGQVFVSGQRDPVAPGDQDGPLLDPAGVAVEGSARAAGARRGEVSIARIAGTASLRGGRGNVTASIAGARGRAFAFQTVAQVAPDRIVLNGSGTLDRKPLTLAGPAVLTRDGDGWRVAATTLGYDGGTATIGGRVGASDMIVDATLARMPMSPGRRTPRRLATAMSRGSCCSARSRR